MKYIPMQKDCLGWKENFEQFNFLIQAHLNRVAALFGEILSSDLVSGELKAKVSKLNQQQCLSLIVSPAVCEILYAIKENQQSQYISALLYQLEYLVNEQLGLVEQTKSLYTNNNIIIDYNGLLHSLGNEKIKPVKLEKAKYYQEQINKALEIIKEVSPNTYSLIDNFTNVIHFREDPSRPNYASWSTHIGIGQIVACNFDYVVDDIEEVVDFIIHESTHNFLHLMEEKYGSFLEDISFEKKWVKEKIVASPWSGEKIDLGSYTHAVCVWYGLANFWQLTSESNVRTNGLAQARVDKMVKQSTAGFIKPGCVHLAAEDKFFYMNKDYLKFSLSYQTTIANSLEA
jgi:hypothetical protein